MAANSQSATCSSTAGTSAAASNNDTLDADAAPIWGRVMNSDATIESPWSRKIILSLGKSLCCMEEMVFESSVSYILCDPRD